MLIKSTIVTAMLLSCSPSEASIEQPNNDLDLMNNDIVKPAKNSLWSIKRMASMVEKHKMTKQIEKRLNDIDIARAEKLKKKVDEKRKKQAEEAKRKEEAKKKVKEKAKKIVKEKQQSTTTSTSTLTVSASAYTYCEQDAYTSCAWGNNTATGKPVKYGYVAVDPSVIPLGTRLKIEGYGDQIFVAEDTGSAIKGNRMDIFLPTHNEAIKFGRKKLKVFILK